MIKMNKENKAIQLLVDAYKSGDENAMKEAWQAHYDEISKVVLEEFETIKEEGDLSVLSQRGQRQLTSKETKFYEKMIETAKSNNPKQAFADLITSEGMPETIIEDVFRDIKSEHPLLSKIKFQNVKYLTNWLMSDGATDKAVWGEISTEIIKQIDSSFKNIKIDLGKLSAFILIARDMLDLGPVFLDNYIRTILKESLNLGLEFGIVYGKGVAGEPIGMIRDIHDGVTVSTTDGYPKKEAVEVENFLPAKYGELCSNLVDKENGAKRTFPKVMLLCNQKDYLKKIMPATTAQDKDGTYKNNLFPFPTEVIYTNVLSDGEALLGLPEEYFLGIGNQKQGLLEYSDDYKFIEDKRAYKAKMYAHGRAVDNTSFILLDISKLEPYYVTVLNKTVTSATDNTTENTETQSTEGEIVA